MKDCSVSSIIERARAKKEISLLLSFSRLMELPSEIGSLKDLRELYLSKNELSSLPSEITQLKLIEKLDLSSNRFSTFPQEIFLLNRLYDLNINSNLLESLPSDIENLKNLISLDLSDNYLDSLPHKIGELQSLAQLYISNNFFESLPPEIGDLKNLLEFDVSGNQLISLPMEIVKLKNLNKLDISENRLTSLPSKISELNNLTQLDISGNQLTSLPPEILELGLEIEWEKKSKSNVIYLGNNPFENPPIEIVKRGREAVQTYFKSLEDEEKPLNEVKVLLVGEGGSGKTSLVKRIFGEDIDGNEPQTQGINIRKWKVKNGGREIKANFWDFGGQEIMHATHQFFLSKRSLYILVLDGRKDEKPEYWLKLIENFGGDSPVLVVINKIDENPAFELNRKFLREKYPSIKGEGFYRLSCKSNEGIGDFSKALREELAKVKPTFRSKISGFYIF